MLTPEQDTGPIVEGFPLSPQQRRAWRVRQATPDATLGVGCLIAIDGAIDEEALEQAALVVFARHEILRTRFSVLPGMAYPLQVIEPATAHDGRRIERLAWSDDQREMLDRMLAAPASQASPSWRIGLASASAYRHALVVAAHPLCADLSSVRLVAEELIAAYAGEEIAEEPPQYADLAAWQNTLLESAETEPGRAFWRGVEREHIGTAMWRGSRAPEGEAFRARTVSARLDAAALEAAATRHEVPIAAVLLAAWYNVLSRVAGDAAASIHYDCHGRSLDAIARAAGPLTRSLPLPCRIEPRLPLAEMLTRLAPAIHEAERWQHGFPSLDSEDDVAAATPIRFDYRETAPARRAREAHFSVACVHDASIPFEMTLSAWRRDDGVQIDLHYDARRMTSTLAHALLALYCGRAQAIVDAGHDAVRTTAACVPEAEWRALLVEWNQTDTPFASSTYREQFDAQAVRTPDAIAVRSAHDTLTYRELDREANRLAHALIARGAGPETRVGLHLPRAARLAVAVLAVLKADAAYVPLDPSYPPARLRWMAADARADVIITSRELASVWDERDARLLTLDSDPPTGIDGAASATPVRSCGDHRHLAYVIYTSGSTGEPKGVLVEQRALMNYLQWAIAAYGNASAGPSLLHTPLGFDLTVTSLLLPWLTGQCVDMLPPDAGADGLLHRVGQHAPCGLIKLTPAHLRLLAQQLTPEAPCSVDLLVVGGESLPAEPVAWWRHHAPRTRIVNEYGPTETVVGCCTHEVRAGERLDGPVPIGHPIANVRLYVLDADGRPTPPGLAGELYIGGAGLARGYGHRPMPTAERFVPDPFSLVPGGRLYRSGDLVRHQLDGALVYLGRLDHQVKLRGYRIEPGEIEAALAQHPEVSASLVALRDEQLVAYVVPATAAKSASPGWIDRLRAHLLQRLPAYMVPSLFVRLAALPLTAHGKVDRAALPDPDTADRVDDDEAQRTPTQRLLAQLWCDVLDREHVSLGDNFFDLGGHSLHALRLSARVRELFGMDLPLRQILDSPHLAAMAADLDAHRGGTHARLGISRIPRDEPLPLSLTQQNLWLHAQLVANPATYNIPGAVHLEGPLDTEALSAALNDVIERHESLRTTFELRDDLPVQRIEARPACPVELVEAESPVDDESIAAIVERQTRQFAREPFALDAWPLVRARLVRLAAESHLLIVTIHHLLVDAWSLDVLTREIAAAYNARVEHRPLRLPELFVQYVDYAAWQRRWMTGEVRERQRDYWKRQLAGMPVLSLGSERPVAIDGDEGALWRFALDAEVSAALERLSRRAGATLFMTMLAAFALLLFDETGVDDVAVGTDMANRPFPELEGVMGFFVNQVVLRTDFSGTPTFIELLARVRRTTLDAHAYQDLPYDNVVRDATAARDASGATLFNVAFSLQHAPARPPRLHDLRVTRHQVYAGAARLHLALLLFESGGLLTGAWRYHTGMLDADRVRRLSRTFSHLVAEIVTDPARPAPQIIAAAASALDREGRAARAAARQARRSSPVERKRITLPE